MLFNSYIFVLFFLPMCLIGYFVMNHFRRYQFGQIFLLVMSLWFYGYFTPAYLSVIIGSIVVNYGFSYMLLTGRSQRLRKALFITALLVNLGVLFYYKYFDFFTENVNVLFGTSFAVRRVLLPLGISFFTFQQISYIIDSYRKEVPVYGFVQYACFVSYFPQLIAGPIVTHDELVPQFMDEDKKHFNWENFAKGIYIFVLGLAKKVLIADTFGNAANWGFSNIPQLNSTNALLSMLAYTIQIYFDFSGYCDMAIGIGQMMNIDLPLNFNSPYKAKDIAQFWSRWHMTLTRFFRKYLYIPLGGNKKGKLRTYVNVMVIYLASGLWHGANWTFILWGIMHGMASVLYRQFKKTVDRLPDALTWLMTFIFINITWVFFRADSIKDACELIKCIGKFDFGVIAEEMIEAFSLAEFTFILNLIPGIEVLHIFPAFLLTAFFAVSLGIVLFSRNTYEQTKRFNAKLHVMLYTAVLMVWCILSFAGVSTFLYFNF